MTYLLAFFLTAATAAAVAFPLFKKRDAAGSNTGDLGSCRNEREKAVALMAIKEADFDHATGKLSEDDHAALKELYEGRALRAMGLLEDAAAADGRAQANAGFCSNCGRRFENDDVFCAACGRRR